MAAWAGRELAPGEQAQTDEEIADYVRRTHNTVYHPVGSVRMGAEDDAMSPLDARLRVKGVTGLRLTTTQMRRAPGGGPAASAFGGRTARWSRRPRAAPSEAGHSPVVSAVSPSTVCPATGAAPPWVTEILRGLACSATGMVRVRTPSL